MDFAIFMTCRDSIAQLQTARRILVLGSSGSGKTTLSWQLSRVLSIEPIHLDAHFWRPGWVSTPQARWHEVVSSLIQRESWIMDGTYEGTLHLRIPAADCLIVLDVPRLTCLWRVLKRKVTIDDHRRLDAPSGQTIDRAFLRHIWNFPVVTRSVIDDCIERFGPKKTLIQPRGIDEIQLLIQQLEQNMRYHRPLA